MPCTWLRIRHCRSERPSRTFGTTLGSGPWRLTSFAFARRTSLVRRDPGQKAKARLRISSPSNGTLAGAGVLAPGKAKETLASPWTRASLGKNGLGPVKVRRLLLLRRLRLRTASGPPRAMPLTGRGFARSTMLSTGARRTVAGPTTALSFCPMRRTTGRCLTNRPLPSWGYHVRHMHSDPLDSRRPGAGPSGPWLGLRFWASGTVAAGADSRSVAGKLKKGTAGEWEQLVEMDICRDSKLHNVLDDSVFAGLCALAFSGNLMAHSRGPQLPDLVLP